MFLVPYLTKKPLYRIKRANFVWLAITIGTALAWIAGDSSSSSVWPSS